jgi:hypothetical protein
VLRRLLRDPYCLFDRGTERDSDRGTERDSDRGTEQDSDRGTERDSDRGTERDSEGLWVFRRPQSFTVMP